MILLHPPKPILPPLPPINQALIVQTAPIIEKWHETVVTTTPLAQTPTHQSHTHHHSTSYEIFVLFPSSQSSTEQMEPVTRPPAHRHTSHSKRVTKHVQENYQSLFRTFFLAVTCISNSKQSKHTFYCYFCSHFFCITSEIS